ncbi:hypothetical protein ACYOEI_24575, partial [Singulisphaera rosea]
MQYILSKLRSLLSRPVGGPPERPPEQDYDFRFDQMPTAPAGLQNLKVERFADRDALLLTGYDVPLTIDQTRLGDSPANIAWSSRCLGWARKYHHLDAPPSPPVRLHGDNVVLLGRALPLLVPDG